jgi:hypothetical protein
MDATRNRDTVLCEEAKQQFWDHERDLVKEGKGTRDWTPEQQEQIMNFKQNGEERKHAGVPADENGEAFEAHHMKSAEAHPQYQGDGKNMQALSHEEHKAAHHENYRNPTNGEYNYKTGDTKEFGENPPTSPEPKALSYPTYKQSQKESQEGRSMADNNSTRSSVTDKLNSMGHKHVDAETKRNPNPESTRATLKEMKNEQSHTDSQG